MSKRKTNPELATRRAAMRMMGYNDGRAGRAAKFADSEYQVSWRRGREARQAAS